MKLPLAAALLATALVGLDPAGQLQHFERRTLDARARHHGARSPFSERIVIVDITEDSIARLQPLVGRWPWPRSLHGEVAEYLAADGAIAIGFDLLFAEPVLRREIDAQTWESVAALAPQADLPEVRQALVQQIEALHPGLGDAQFAASVAKAGNVYQAAVCAPGPDAAEAPALPPQVPVAAVTDAAVRGQVLLPFPELAQASHGVGHINALPDVDGVYRRFFPLLWCHGRSAAYPALGVAMAAHVLGVPLAQLQRIGSGLALGARVLPLAEDDSAWVHYQGGSVQPLAHGGEAFHSFYRHVAYEDVLASKDLHASGQAAPLPRGTFRNQIVLISAQAAGLSDLRATPFSAVTPGIEIHANIIDSLLAQRFLRAPPALLLLGLCFAVSGGVALCAHYLRIAFGLPLALALAAGSAGAIWSAYGHGWVLTLVQPLVAMALAYGSVLLARAARAEHERRWLRNAFGHYLAPAVLEQILQAPERLRLGGERRHMTVLFSDVAGFTSIAEQLAPEQVSALLNDYLDHMTACVTRTGGTLDKFVGDAVMAEWNAPLAQADHAARACEASLLMLEELQHCQRLWRQNAGVDLDMRIGINTGAMVVGNMGSHQIFDYTVIGNEVNTAARLEPLNKAFGTRILVAGATKAEAENQRPGYFAFRALGRVSPKGRAQALDVFELVDWQARLDDAQRAHLADFACALTHFQARRFPDALCAFQALVAKQPHDGPSLAFVARCHDLMAQPPPSAWDGVFVQTDK